MSLGDSGNLGDLLTFRRYLPDVTFPASKEEVASVAESNDAPQDLVQLLRTASVERFGSSDEVLDYLTERTLRSGGGGGGLGSRSRPAGYPTTSPPEEDFPGDWTGGGPDDL